MLPAKVAERGVAAEATLSRWVMLVRMREVCSTNELPVAVAVAAARANLHRLGRDNKIISDVVRAGSLSFESRDLTEEILLCIRLFNVDTFFDADLVHSFLWIRFAAGGGRFRCEKVARSRPTAAVHSNRLNSRNQIGKSGR